MQSHGIRAPPVAENAEKAEFHAIFEGRDDNLKRKDFVEFGKRFGVPQQAIDSRLDRLISRAAPFIPRVKEIGYEARVTKQLIELMKKRLADLK